MPSRSNSTTASVHLYLSCKIRAASPSRSDDISQKLVGTGTLSVGSACLDLVA